jgi:hypothetical protein
LPDAGGVVHGLEHVVGELANLRRHLLDGLGDQPELLVRQDDDFSEGHDARFKLLICRGQSARTAIKAALTMIFKAALTMKIKAPFTINVPSSFANAGESATHRP